MHRYALVLSLLLGLTAAPSAIKADDEEDTANGGGEIETPVARQDVFSVNVTLLGSQVRRTFIVLDEGGIDVADLAEGEAPPPLLRYRASGARAADRAEGRINPVLNVPSARLELPSRTGAIEFARLVNPSPDAEESWETYTSIDLTAGRPASVFLARSANGTWSDPPRVVVLPDDLDSFPERSVRVVNFASLPLIGLIGDEAIQLRPGSETVVTPETGEEAASLQVAAVDADGTRHPAINTGRTLRPGDRIVIAVWDYNGNDPDNHPTPVDSTLFYQPEPLAPPADED